VNCAFSPIYQVAFPPAVTDEELLGYFDVCETWSKGVNAPVGWVIDLSSVTRVTPRQRALFAEYQERMTPFDRRYNCASAIVISNAIVRGFVTAVYWLKPPVYPYQMFGLRSEALSWVKQLLRQRRP
jgi:hypothetical protein